VKFKSVQQAVFQALRISDEDEAFLAAIDDRSEACAPNGGTGPVAAE
jgi:hypothetical protein